MKKRKSSFSITGAIIFFFLIALVMQIAILAYDYIIQRTDSIGVIAVLILFLIIILSAICTAIDIVRRKILVSRPVEKILDATESISRGDFSIRLISSHSYEKYNEYDLIMENINIMAEELRKSEILKSDFISNVSHEIKTPLAIIQSYATLLSDESLDSEERKRCIGSLLSATKRLNELISSILKMNKLENQGIVPERVSFSLTSQLSDSIVSFEEFIDKKELCLECDLEDMVITSCPSYLEIVWNNLLSNAIKFTDNGGAITVSLKRNDKNAIVSISDTGCGIDTETGKRIFEKFYQGDTSRKEQGNGLGLALVKRVIDILGGEILVDSVKGQGSTFTITLKDVINE